MSVHKVEVKSGFLMIDDRYYETYSCVPQTIIANLTSHQHEMIVEFFGYDVPMTEEKTKE